MPTYDFPRPSLTVDVLVFDSIGEILLIQRGKDPFAGRWALPGGFVNEGESLSQAASRELLEETGLGVFPGKLRQLGAFGDPGRDPRGWVVSVAFTVTLSWSPTVRGADDAADARWFRDPLPPLAFDHDLIIQTALAEKAQ